MHIIICGRCQNYIHSPSDDFRWDFSCSGHMMTSSWFYYRPDLCIFTRWGWKITSGWEALGFSYLEFLCGFFSWILTPATPKSNWALFSVTVFTDFTYLFKYCAGLTARSLCRSTSAVLAGIVCAGCCRASTRLTRLLLAAYSQALTLLYRSAWVDRCLSHRPCQQCCSGLFLIFHFGSLLLVLLCISPLWLPVLSAACVGQHFCRRC